MRLPNAEHAAHPWVIAQIAPDFELIDAWALPAQGGPDGFDALLKIMASLDGANAESGVTRALFRVRASSRHSGASWSACMSLEGQECGAAISMLAAAQHTALTL